MTISNLFKQLKRRLRMRKRWLTLGAYLLLAGGAAAMVAVHQSDKPVTDKAVISTAISIPVDLMYSDTPNQEVLETIAKNGGTRDVFIHKKYVCVEEIQQLGSMKPKEIMSLHREHPDSRVVVDEAGQVHMVEEIEDLAPKCRKNAHFGMDKNGNLTLFEGIPEQERVIRTFFQLNVQHLKSSLPTDVVEKLYSGIRIGDLADYNSVLSTFSEFAAEQAEPVSHPQP